VTAGGYTSKNSYEQWLAWKHGAQLRERALRWRMAEQPQDPDHLDWGDQALLENSVALIRANARQLVEHFYADLFNRLPGVRKLFPSDMAPQRDRLLTALLALVESGPALAPVLAQLGRDHRKFSVREVHYAAVGDALVAALTAFSGEHWTPAVEHAWRARYTAAAKIMTTAAATDDQPPFWYASVVDRSPCGDNVAILRLRPHRPYAYTAGQYATIESPRLPRVWRAYSMATPPKFGKPLEFHIRALGRGGLSDVLVNAEPGDTVRLGPAQGTISLGSDPAQPRLFVAGGTGWSMIKALLGQHVRERPAPATLLASFRPGEPYDPAFDDFVHELPQVETRLVHDADQLRAALSPDRLPSPFLNAYVSGPPGLIDSAVRLLATAGVGKTHIYFDNLVH
jgi:ferredoxin-NADP reductase/hemoglobin-like flavoprotein